MRAYLHVCMSVFGPISEAMMSELQGYLSHDNKFWIRFENHAGRFLVLMPIRYKTA